MDSRHSFAENLRARRRAAGLTQRELGEMLTYSSKAVSKWESGLAIPPAELLPVLAAALHTDLNTLFAFRGEPDWFLGIDGGGTKTDFQLADRGGTILRSECLGACSPTALGLPAALSVLETGIRRICTGLSPGQVSVYAGIAGGGVAENRTAIAEFLGGFGFARTGNGSDAQNIIAAGLHGRDGVAAVLGTGSVAFSVRGGTLRQVGGYGHLFGDCAGGYELGRACIMAAAAERDGSGPKTLLTELTEERAGGEVLSCLDTFYEKGKPYIASFAPLLFEACGAGDAAAQKILRENLTAFAARLNAARGDFGPCSGVPVVLAGGLTRYRDILLPILLPLLPGCRGIEILKEKPVRGALLLAGMPEPAQQETRGTE